MTDIQTAISSLSIVLCLCGFGVFEYPLNQPKNCLYILYILILWLSYGYIAFETKIFLQKNELTLPLIHRTNMVFAILYMLNNFYYNKKFKSCLDKLNIVSNTLEKLGILKNYAKLRVQTIWLITGWIISMFLINIIDCIWLSKHILKSYVVMVICAPFISNHPVHINTLYDFMYMLLLRYVGSQFENINKYIRELAKQENQRIRYTGTTSILNRRYMAGPEVSKQNIWILMHIYLELCSISRKLNTIFGLQMVMQAVAFHVFTVQIVYECYSTMTTIYSDFTHEKLINLIGIYIWITSNIIKMIVLNYICESVCIKANRAEMFLNRLTNFTLDVETHEIVMQFLFQILLRPLKISGLGLFNFGFKFLLKCTSFIAMVIVFVIQSPPQEENFISVDMRRRL